MDNIVFFFLKNANASFVGCGFVEGGSQARATRDRVGVMYILASAFFVLKEL